MTSAEKTPYTILKEYADALAAFGATTSEEKLGEIADDLLLIESDISTHAKGVARLIHRLLEQNSKAAVN